MAYPLLQRNRIKTPSTISDGGAVLKTLSDRHNAADGETKLTAKAGPMMRRMEEKSTVVNLPSRQRARKGLPTMEIESATPPASNPLLVRRGRQWSNDHWRKRRYGDGAAVSRTE